ncbi:hypothetical protein LINPERHAP1_LOCUS20125 [Linum perenne]
MIPGMYPRIVSSKQIQNSTPHPNLRNTPRGGSRIARIMSTQVAAPMIALNSGLEIDKMRLISDQIVLF